MLSCGAIGAGDQKVSIIHTFDAFVHRRKARCFPSCDGTPQVSVYSVFVYQHFAGKVTD